MEIFETGNTESLYNIRKNIKKSTLIKHGMKFIDQVYF